MPPDVLRWLVALSFFAVAMWALKPDTLDDDEPPPATRWGVFGVTVVAFFLAEMGDKTQVATVVLAARFPSLARRRARHDARHAARQRPGRADRQGRAAKIPFKAVRIAAALLFAALGVYALVAPELPGT